MAGAVVRVLGVARFSARLSRMRKANNEKLVDAVNKGAAIVVGAAKTIAPVDSGQLRASIHQIKAEVSDGKVTSGAATSKEYAPYVEFGTGVRGDGSYPHEVKDTQLAYSPDWPGQVAQPFMYPALHQNKDKIKKLVRLAVISAAVGGGK